MIQVTPLMRVFVAIEPADFRCGIDGLASRARNHLALDPMSGSVFVFRNRRGTSIKVLAYDGQGFWLCQKRLSRGHFPFWPSRAEGVSATLEAQQLVVLLAGGDFEAARGVPPWRRVGT